MAAWRGAAATPADKLSAAVRDLDRDGLHDLTENYQALMLQYDMQPSANTAGCANQNGDVEQSHFRFKTAIDQALPVRGSRDFADRGTYERFLLDLVRIRNMTRSQRFEADQAALRPLPTEPLDFGREFAARVSRFSLIRVPSRLIGAKMALRRIHYGIVDRGAREVVDTDLADYFNTILHGRLLRCVARRIADGTVLAVIRQWLDAPVVERD